MATDKIHCLSSGASSQNLTLWPHNPENTTKRFCSSHPTTCRTVRGELAVLVNESCVGKNKNHMRQLNVVISPTRLITCRLGQKHLFGKDCRLAASCASPSRALPLFALSLPVMLKKNRDFPSENIPPGSDPIRAPTPAVLGTSRPLTTGTRGMSAV